jgi:hypothetical protein
MGNIRSALIILAASFLVLSSCATNISSLREDPDSFVGETLVLRGEVKRQISLPGVNFAVFVLSDESGRIPVVTRAPRERGDRVRIRAEIIGLPEERTEQSLERSVRRLIDFLVSNDIVSRNNAARVARTLAGSARELAQNVGGSYFAIERN